MTRIRAVRSRDLRFPLEHGAGADAIHGDPAYSYALTCLDTDQGIYWQTNESGGRRSGTLDDLL